MNKEDFLDDMFGYVPGDISFNEIEKAAISRKVEFLKTHPALLELLMYCTAGMDGKPILKIDTDSLVDDMIRFFGVEYMYDFPQPVVACVRDFPFQWIVLVRFKGFDQPGENGNVAFVISKRHVPSRAEVIHHLTSQLGECSLINQGLN